jgi:hypothetical protein
MQVEESGVRRAVRRLPLGVSRRVDRLFGRFLGNGAGLEHPYTTPLHYMPPLWYRPHWPAMPAFALPSFSDGFVRINLKGRESRGMVDPEDYAAFCAALTAALGGLRDARTGAPVVAEVRRSWPSGRVALAEAGEPGAPQADLVVVWGDRPSDVVDSADCGRIGPLPFRQSGGHTTRGFFGLAGAEGAPGRLAAARLIDLAPTILDLLGVALPNHLEGRSLVR